MRSYSTTGLGFLPPYPTVAQTEERNVTSDLAIIRGISAYNQWALIYLTRRWWGHRFVVGMGEARKGAQINVTTKGEIQRQLPDGFSLLRASIPDANVTID